MCVIINPEFAINILEYWESIIIYNGSIFTKKKVNAVKKVSIHIVLSLRWHRNKDRSC